LLDLIDGGFHEALENRVEFRQTVVLARGREGGRECSEQCSCREPDDAECDQDFDECVADF
jgi:hypothetical protein